MRRGDSYFANLEPVQSSEDNKVSPVLIISKDVLNEAVDTLQQGVITVIPLTSDIETIKVVSSFSTF